jgi:hypothetical protein
VREKRKQQSSDLNSYLQNLEKSLSDLLGADSIDNRIEDRRNKEIEVGQQGVDWRRHLVTKPVNKGRKSNGNIENQYGTDMRTTCSQDLKPGFRGGKPHHSPENHHIRGSNSH